MVLGSVFGFLHHEILRLRSLFLKDAFIIKLKSYVIFLKLYLLMLTFLLSLKSNCFYGSDSSPVSEGPNENYVEISFDRATSDKRNVKQIILHNGKW